MALEDAKKAVSTIDLMLSAIGILKSLAIVFGMTLLEFARKKQKLAEAEADVAKVDLKVATAKTEIDKKYADKTPDQVINDFLARRKL